MGSKVTIGCKLPHGIRAEVGGVSIKFNGINSATVHNGHGITKNVEKEFWDAWLEKNQGLAFVRNGFVFAHERQAKTMSQAKEQQGEQTGLEPLDPSKLPKDIKPVPKDDQVDEG